MKKSLVLGAAALASLVAAAPQAEAADVKLSGYYQIRFTDADQTLTDSAIVDEYNGWHQRVQLDLDAKISDKTSAHLHMRPLGSSDIVTGSNSSDAQDDTTNGNLDIKRAWMETEMYGVAVKAGNMPLNVNDKMLFKDDGGSFGTLLLAKSFGDITVVGLQVQVYDDSSNGASTSDDDEADIYGLSILGKAANVNYQLTWAHLDVGTSGTTPVAVSIADSNNDWIALTLGTELSGINLTATGIYEAGHDQTGVTSGQLADSDFMLGLRAKGKTGFGGWSSYAFYAGEDFNHPLETYTTNKNAQDFSPTWRRGGAGSVDLVNTWAGSASLSPVSTAAATTNGASGYADNMQNMWGVGLGLTVKAGSWTVNPNIDYVAIVEDMVGGVDTTSSESAVAGSLIATTKLDEGTTFSLIGTYLKASDDDTTADGVNGDVEDMHGIQAEFKVKF